MVVALDHGGPRNVEYEEFCETWVQQGIVPRFLAIAADTRIVRPSSMTASP
jgi:hypothetical protein